MGPATGRPPAPLLESFSARFDRSVTLLKILGDRRLTLEHIGAVLWALIHTFDDRTLAMSYPPGVGPPDPKGLKATVRALKAAEDFCVGEPLLCDGRADGIRQIRNELSGMIVRRPKGKGGRPPEAGTWLMHELDEALLRLELTERAELIAGLVSEFVAPIGYRTIYQRIDKARRPLEVSSRQPAS